MPTVHRQSREHLRSGGIDRPARHRRVLLGLAGIGAIAAIAAGCGSAAATSASPTTAAAPAAAASQPYGASPPAGSTSTVSATKITATLTEFKIALSTTKLVAGRYTFVARNAGHTLHSLSIKGPGVTATLPSGLEPGQSGRMTVTLGAGKYDVFCPVGDHKQLGMNLELTVSA